MLVVDTAVMANPVGVLGDWWSTVWVSAEVILSAVGQLVRAAAVRAWLLDVPDVVFPAAVAVGATAQRKMARTTGVRRRRLMKQSFREGTRRLPYPRPIGSSRGAL
jgi:hypothetical protein